MASRKKEGMETEVEEFAVPPPHGLIVIGTVAKRWRKSFPGKEGRPDSEKVWYELKHSRGTTVICTFRPVIGDSSDNYFAVGELVRVPVFVHTYTDRTGKVQVQLMVEDEQREGEF